MLPYRDSRITIIAIIVFFALVLGYAYFEARGLLYGPRITVSSAPAEVHDPFVVISGKADRIASLAMNGKAITVTEDGSFSEPYLLSPGLNRIILDAKDRYGRDRQQIIQIVYTPATPTPIQATTTTSAATFSSAQ